MIAVPGYRITETLHEGTWTIYRGNASDGARVIVTVVASPPPADALELPFSGIPALRDTVTLRDGFAVVETEPAGWRIADLKWPLPIDEVIRVGLDLARVLERMHAAGVVHGSLRPQTVWIDEASTLTGTTPRPERAGLPTLSESAAGTLSPFIDDIFLPDVLARGEPASVTSDVAQLGMMLYRMATHRSPFAGDSITQQLVRAMNGDAPPWSPGDARSRAVEALARAAFDPARISERTLASLRAGLEQCAR